MATHAPITGAQTRTPIIPNLSRGGLLGIAAAGPDAADLVQLRDVTLDSIAEVCARLGIAPTRFGRDAVSDPRLVLDMRAGRKLRPGTARRVAEYLAKLEGC